MFQLSNAYRFKIPSIVKYETLKGDQKEGPFWDEVFVGIEILPFNDSSAKIAAIAMDNDLKLATLNEKDFTRINGLVIITPNNSIKS